MCITCGHTELTLLQTTSTVSPFNVQKNKSQRININKSIIKTHSPLLFVLISHAPTDLINSKQVIILRLPHFNLIFSHIVLHIRQSFERSWFYIPNTKIMFSFSSSSQFHFVNSTARIVLPSIHFTPSNSFDSNASFMRATVFRIRYPLDTCSVVMVSNNVRQST